jgi:hypothetical protein
LTTERAFDGRHATVVYHRDQTVAFFTLSPLQVEVQTRRHLGERLKAWYVADPTRTGRCSQVGRERVADALCNVWEGTAPHATAKGHWQVRAWLETETGELLRLEACLRPHDEQSIKKRKAGPTVRQLYEVLDRDVPIPKDRLSLQPPAGYSFTSTKQAAISQKFAWGDISQEIRSAGVFSLPGGSLLIGWRPHVADAAFERKWAQNYMRLRFGELLPLRPSHSDEFWELHEVESPLLYATDLTDLRTVGLDPEVRLAGRHLTTTEDETGVWEWSVHVPEGGPLDRSCFFCYALSASIGWRIENGKLVDRHRVESKVGDDVPIANETDYRQLVVGAMKEYSACQPSRTFPRHDQLMLLVRTLHESAKR